MPILLDQVFFEGVGWNHTFWLDISSKCKSQFIEGTIGNVIYIIYNLSLKECIWKLIYLKGKQLFLQIKISKLKVTFLLCFELFKFFDKILPDVSSKVAINILVVISVSAVLWHVRTEINVVLELLRVSY